MASMEEFGPQLTVMLKELEKRAKKCKRNLKYLDGCAPVPHAVESARLTKAYNLLMSMSSAPWASLAVGAKQDRLEIGGIRTGDKGLDETLWRDLWQANGLDSESKLAHNGILTNGRAFATVWPDPQSGEVEIVLDPADQMIVQYREGRHQARYRGAGLRHWCDDDDKHHMTLYRADGLYKFSEAKEQTRGEGRVLAHDRWWQQREEKAADGLPEPWPLPNPFGVVNVVEILTNRRLQAGGFPYARGEFELEIGLLDRINLLTFLGLVVAVWMGFPLRGVIGDRILRDDDDNPLPPFESKPDGVFQIENPAAKIEEFKAADRKNLSPLDELAQFAYLTSTPAHYFPMTTGLSNISADMIRALEGAMHATVDGIHKPFIGEGWEEVMHVGGLMLPVPVEVPRSTEMWWMDKQSRSLAESADAAGKLKDLLPAMFIAEKYLNLTQEEISRVEAGAAGGALEQLIREASAPPPVPVLNGSGAA